MQENIPKYIAIYNELKASILSNDFFPDTVFPSESELMKRYSASRTTIRRVLSQLREDKLIEISRGKRTRVSSTNLSNASYTFLKRDGVSSISKRFKVEGEPQITSQSIIVDEVEASQEVAQALELSIGAPVYRLQRVKLVNDMNFSYITSYISKELTPGLDRYSGQFHYLFSFLKEHYNIHPETEKRVITTGVTDFQVSRILNSEIGEQLLVSKKTVLQANRPIEYSVTLNRSSLVEIVIEGASPSKVPERTEVP